MQQDVLKSPQSGTGKVRERRTRTLLKVTLALLVGVVFAALLAELVVVLFVGEQPKFPRRVVEAPWGLRYNEPASSYRHKSADVTVYFRINAQGMRRDQDVAYQKPEGVRRIISLGDSFTIGYEVDVEQTFSSILESELNAAGIRTEVLNAGVSGFSTAEQCLYLERELLKYEPDLVVLSFYGNDLVDNMRIGLFAIRDGKLVEAEKTYVPGGAIGNFLNTNWFFNLLSERSNAFVLAKERLTLFVKNKMVKRNQDNVARGNGEARDVGDEKDRRRKRQRRSHRRGDFRAILRQLEWSRYTSRDPQYPDATRGPGLTTRRAFPSRFLRRDPFGYGVPPGEGVSGSTPRQGASLPPALA